MVPTTQLILLHVDFTQESWLETIFGGKALTGYTELKNIGYPCQNYQTY